MVLSSRSRVWAPLLAMGLVAWACIACSSGEDLGPPWADNAEGAVRSEPLIVKLVGENAEWSSVVSGGNATDVRSDGSILIEFDAGEELVTAEQVDSVAATSGWEQVGDATWARCIEVLYGGGGANASQAKDSLYAELALGFDRASEPGSSPPVVAGRVLVSRWGPTDIVPDSCP